MYYGAFVYNKNKKKRKRENFTEFSHSGYTTIIFRKYNDKDKSEKELSMNAKKWMVAMLAAACVLGATGCSQEPVGIASIEKTATVGLTDTYTIYYIDGTTSVFEVTNGADGKDVSVEALYATYVEKYGDISYADFLALYLSENTENYTSIGRCLLSTAKIYTEFTERLSSGGRYPGMYTQRSQYMGSAIIYEMEDEYTYFLTNYHMVYSAYSTADDGIADTIYCYLYGSEDDPVASGSSYDYGDYAIACEYVGGSVLYDVAVVKALTADVKKINEDARPVELAEGYHVGQTAIAIGNPNGEGLSVTQGIVSVDNEFISLSLDGTTRAYRSIRIDTALYSGNSGGGLFNVQGQLIGLNNAGATEDQNINYAVPLAIVEGAAGNILYYHRDGDDGTNGLYKLTLGFEVVSENSRYVYDADLGYGNIVEDILISAVTEDSIAEDIGLRAGDKIRTFTLNGKTYELNRDFDIADIILRLTAGTEFYVTYERDGNAATTKTYTVKQSDVALV